jgi:KaiC/GvpD/RAD55 family RecA-like ATPase
MRCAADIETRPLRALWPGVIYRRKVALVAGDPGLGKSLATCDIAARISTGADWPGNVSAISDPSSVVIISGEDDADDTIVPRLKAAGADLDKIFIIDDVVEKRDGELSVLSLAENIKAIDTMMRRVKASLLIIDPISAFMGSSDSHKDTSVRALLAKVRQYAADGEYAVLLVTHFNKPGEKLTSAIHRVMGSLGFVGASRSVFAFVRDPNDHELRLFLPIKNNLGPDTEGFRCHVEVDRTQNLSPPPVYLQWDDEPPKGEHIDAVLAQPSPREQARKAKEQEISKWLDGFMKRGKKVRSTKFNAAVQEQGFSAKKVTEIMVKFGYKKGQKKFHGKWWVTRDKRTDGQDARL